jgi:hypothetical protein
VACTTADPANKKPPALLACVHQKIDHEFDGIAIELL